MLNQENNYDFRKRMLEIHEKNIRNFSLVANDNEFEFKDGTVIFVSDTAGDVILTAARDFVDYLFTSMNISARLKCGKYSGCDNAVVIGIASETGADLGDCAEYRGYRIDTEKNAVFVHGFDERGAAQALYSLEDIMSIRKAPFLKMGSVCRKPMFSPQMVHSGYGLDEYPNEHLNAIAHEGRDAILVFVKDVNVTPYGYLDFNELIYRASKYGLDVYAYSYLESKMHPDDEGAEAYYESTYGRLFKTCPGLKGVSLVGESVEFPSKDEHVGHRRLDNFADGIPTGKRGTGAYPCYDYADWVKLIKKIVRKYNSEADIVFWTYNWGAAPADARLKLINKLPTDITLMATFEMGEHYTIDGSTSYIFDYTISQVGYGENYFKTEAEACAKRGIRLYSMTNTGGLTWDIGVIPYVPTPYQWMKRYTKMKEAHDKFGLCGIMESHHYGFYPSIISKLSKMAFYNNCENMEELLRSIIAGEYGSENVEVIDKALELWSDAISYCVPNFADQYGAFRVGPSYPFNLDRVCQLPAATYAHFGNAIITPTYRGAINCGRTIPTPILVKKEIKSLERMKELLEEGLKYLNKAETKNEKLLRLINMGEFMIRTVITGINAKKWHQLKCAILHESDHAKIVQIINDMEIILNAEKENVENTIPLVQVDSRLGWEPSMEYMTDEYHLNWKLRQLKFVLDIELGIYNKTAVKYDTGVYMPPSIDF